MEPVSYKVIFLGNPGVGKTTLFRKLKYPDSKESMTDSLNLTPCMLEFLLEQSVRVQLRLNDTGSTERFRSVPTNYFRHSHGVVLVYDVTNPTSLYDLEDWMVDAYSKTAEDSTITYTIIGTRLDKVEETGTESSDCKHFCERFGIPEYLQFRVSDLSEGLHQSLMEIFKTLAQTIHVTQSGGNVTKTRNYNHLRSSERALLLSSDQDSEKSTPCFKC